MDEETKPVYLEPEFWLDIISRRRWLIIIPLLLSGIVGLYLALTLPKEYSATTLIAVQPQRVPDDYVQSLVTTGIESRISTLSQEILSRTNLEKIISKFNLFSEPEQQNIFMEDKVGQLRQRIQVSVSRDRGRRGNANAFSITYAGSSPERVSAITNTLASFFIDENLKIREAQALGTSDFLQDELNTMKERLEQTEAALRTYRFQYMGELPDQLDSNLRILDRLQRELADKEKGLREAKMRLVALTEQPLNTNKPTSIGYRKLSAGQLQSELTRLQSRYTDKHPDIILLKQLIKEAQSGTPEGESRAITETRDEIAETEEAIANLRAEIARYNSRVENAPQREEDLISLQRDYSNLRKSYNDLLNRKLEAEIAVNMERKQKGEQFRVIDPARTPVRPTSPDMQKLLLFAFAAGLGLGAGLCFVLEYLNPVFRRPDEIETFLGIPLIATIPSIYSRKKKVVRWLNNTMTITASGVTCVTYAMFGVLLLSGEDTLKMLLRDILNITI
jgi:polysaccharide chain length determinant protein (PEP-CTERM system associated)